MAEPPDSDDTLTGAPSASSSVRSPTLKLLSSPRQGVRSLADADAVREDPAVSAEVAGLTDIGKVRANNQDQFLVAALERSLFVEGSSLPAQAGTRVIDTPHTRLLIVADGIGGHGGGEVASAVAIDAMAHYAFAVMPWVLRHNPKAQESLVKGLQEALRRAQDRVRRVAKRKSLAEDLGTTFTMAYITWPDCWILHVGDSRAYLLRDGALHRLTHDHTLAQQLLESEPTSAEDPKRYQHLSHVLVNAVGGRTDELDIELHHARLYADDLLMLCTDGLTGPVSDGEIQTEMARAERPVAEIVRRLVARANAAGGRDNVTVVVARF